MSLLKELHSLSSDSTRAKVVSMFLNNMKKADLSHLKSDEAMEKVLNHVRAQDKDGVLKRLSDEALEQLIRVHLEPTLEAEETPDVDSSEEDEPRLLVKAGDFKVMVFPNELVKIMDNADNVRLEMPLVIWKQLSRG